MTKWYQKDGYQGDVVVSTRIRIARNLKDFPFVNRLSNDEMSKVAKLVSNAIINSNSMFYNTFKEIDMSKLEQIDVLSLIEKHLISPEFSSNRKGKVLLLNDDESISIMINEEDHIRVQVMKEGLALNDVFNVANKIDTILDEKLDLAFNDEFGYLTQCPTNLGTGMRASLLLHLPALQEIGSMNRIANNLSKLGLTIRGTYGEGSEAKGALYQLSNQVTLGISEKAAIENLKNICMQLMEQERSTRNSMVKNMDVVDSIYRSYGVLKNARLISNDEFMKLISNVRLGISTKIIDDISYDLINDLIINVQPATLMLGFEDNLTPLQRDEKRAEIVRLAFNNN